MMNLKKVTQHSLLHTLNPCSTLICQKESVKMKSQSQDLHILCFFDQCCVYIVPVVCCEKHGGVCVKLM